MNNSSNCTECAYMYVCKFMDEYLIFKDKVSNIMNEDSAIKEPSCVDVKIACKYFRREPIGLVK